MADHTTNANGHVAGGAADGRRWQDVMQLGDRDAFHALVEDQTSTLIEAARRELDFYVHQGYLHRDDLTPEEVAGQTLIFAWEHRDRCPRRMSLRGWLLGTQHRVLRGLAEAQRDYRHDKALSLDEPVPLDPANYDTQEWFWEWYQPDAELYFEDVVADRLPDEVELSPDDGDPVHDDPAAHQSLVLHDEFEMTLPEVAFTMNRSVDSIAEMLQKARASLRERMPADEGIDTLDQPARPEGSDR